MPSNTAEYPQPRLSAAEAAAILAVKSEALQAAVDAGTLRQFRDGQGTVEYTIQDLRDHAERLQ
ncbi:hypothetical protein [Terriglobus sp. RCC_193]|uniref:hypothetical protein n=1 Tax=Terriglobus sp. RCC_193 TaxID=3239218 RepID=UPI0035236CE5